MQIFEAIFVKLQLQYSIKKWLKEVKELDYCADITIHNLIDLFCNSCNKISVQKDMIYKATSLFT